MIISRTPMRISFFGGGTDYPGWFRKHGGTVLATTIDKYCYLSCRYLPPFFDYRYRVVYSRIESCNTIEEIEHPAVRAVLRHLHLERGLAIHHDGDLPARSGMGSSSAFTVGLLHGLYALKGKMPSKHQLATEGIHLEQEVLKELVGSQDQVCAAYGGFNHITFFPNGEIAVHPVTISGERLRELDSHLMLFYTGIQRTAAEVAESYVSDLTPRKRQLRIMQDLVSEALSLLNSRQSINEFGELLQEAWQAKRSLSPRVSNREVDAMYEAGLAAGAVGGKLTGAGGGGFLLLFVPPGKQKKVREALAGLIHVPFRFEFGGSQIVFFDAEEDYAALDKARAHRGAPAFRELQELHG
jgi:D-glycero-alpha-D-manno-heptose-7-phosphate kinase